jgi:hypothetical protein
MVVVHLTRIGAGSCECGIDPLNSGKGNNFLYISLIVSTYLGLYSMELGEGAGIPIRD